ncbi:hypothetical protein SAMN02745150_00548 [Brevinema andersonii]|uniref:PKD domain-containing protein n=1 Tax=Brevinema andersonii TaxID=34097 RepID=A0A1I1DJ30_BREAD|nr:hypothetical protein [Brevinema andersonii]SFB74446.1 hypothetical protein SAMN02745150_00548 [Brevinema andersonii]
MFSWKGIYFYLIILFLSSCRTFPVLIDGQPNRLVVNKDTGWSILSQHKFYTKKDRYSLQGMKDSFDVFYFEGTSYTVNNANLSSVPTSSVSWRFPYLKFAHMENEWLLNWDFAFSSKKFIATVSTNTVLDDIVFRVLERSALDQWDLLVEFKPRLLPDDIDISLGVSADNQKGVLAYIDGDELWAAIFQATQQTSILTFRVLSTIPEKFLALQNNANESIFVYLDTTESLYVKKMKNKSVITERLISYFPSQNVSLFQDRDLDYIIWIVSDENNKLNIQTLNLNTYELVTKNKNPINGSNGILRKDKNGLYYLAFITPEDKPRVITTQDFNSWTQLGSYTISSSEIKDLNFALFDTSPVIGYIDNSYLHLMIYDNQNFIDKPIVSVQQPVAVIEAPSRVVPDRPFTVSGTNSINYNQNPLTYYWKIVHRGIFNNPYSPTPSITIPAIGTYDLILEVSDGIQLSAPVTNKVTTDSSVRPTKVNFTVIAQTSLLEATRVWANIDTTFPLKFYIKDSTNTLFVTNFLYDPQVKQFSGNFTVPYTNTALTCMTFLTIEDIHGNTILSSPFENTVAANQPSALDSQDTVKITNTFQYSHLVPPPSGSINWVIGTSSTLPKTIELVVPARQLYTENFLYDLMPLNIVLKDEENNQVLATEVISTTVNRPLETGYFTANWRRIIDPSVGLAYRDVKMYISNARGDSLEVSLAFNIPTAAASYNITITNNGTWRLKQSPTYPYAYLVAKDIGGFNGSSGELFHALKAERDKIGLAGYSTRCGLFFNMLEFPKSTFGSPSVNIATNNNLDPSITPGTGVRDLYGYFNPMLNGGNNLQYSLMYFNPISATESELNFRWGSSPKSLQPYAFTFTNSADSIVQGSSRILYANFRGTTPHLVFTYNTESTATPNSFVVKRAYIPFDAGSPTVPSTPIEPTINSVITAETSLRGAKMRFFVVGSSTNTVGANAFQDMWVTLGNTELLRYSYRDCGGVTDFVSSTDEQKTFPTASYIPIIHTLDNSRELYIAAYVDSVKENFSLTRINDDPSIGPIDSDDIGTADLYIGIPNEATKMTLDVPTTNKTIAMVSDIVFHDANSTPQQYLYVFWINKNNEVYGARALQNEISMGTSPNPTWEHMGRIATHAISIEAFPNEQNRPVLFIKNNSGKISIYEVNLK